MAVVIAALLPVFLLIVFGFVLKRSLMRLAAVTMPIVIALVV